MPKKVKKALDGFSTIVVVLIVILAVLLVGVRLVGLQVFAVLSGSMEPTYHTGSLIYVKEVDPAELEAGDVITFMISEDTVVTHRIAGVVPDDEDPTVLRFRTKGDANDAEDATLVHEMNIIGTPVFTIPYLGYLSNYIQNPPGTYIAITIAALVLMLMFIPDLLDDDQEKAKKKAVKAPAEKADPSQRKPRKEKSPAKSGGRYQKAASEEPVRSKEGKARPAAPAAQQNPQKAAVRTAPAEKKPAAARKAPAAQPARRPAPAAAQNVPQRSQSAASRSTQTDPGAEDFDFDKFLEELKRDLNQ